ncbi:MAG: DUF2809 domain-containing protein [Deltaproteobacteria bacterium]|nr:DUF2809 domain-containing protein [Deltaproteobacteria bacterium]
MPLRLALLLSLLVITPSGFLAKFYSGPGQFWVNNHLVGVLYVIFWILLAFFLWPRRKYLNRIPLGVLAATCLLEVLQLWHPWPLEAVRGTFLGRTILGTSFDWLDFPHYLAGAALGRLWVGFLFRRVGGTG